MPSPATQIHVLQTGRVTMKMGPDPKLFDDIVRMAGGAVNIFSGLQQQIRDEIKSRIDETASRLDLVTREDMDRAEARIARLEKELAALKGAGGKDTAPKAAKKAKAKTASGKAARK